MHAWVAGALVGAIETGSKGLRRVLLASGAVTVLILAQTGALAVVDPIPSDGRIVAMRTGSITSQPIGHYEFCRRSPDECNDRTRDARPVPLTAARWIAITEINDAVNGGIEPRTDMEMHGRTELWSFPDVAGDCEDYVLLKRRLLIERGFDPSSLLITVVRRPNGEGHAILTVRTDRGEFVLDNLETRVVAWTQTPYRFLKRQSAHHSGRWVDIMNGDVRTTASLR